MKVLTKLKISEFTEMNDREMKGTTGGNTDSGSSGTVAPRCTITCSDGTRFSAQTCNDQTATCASHEGVPNSGVTDDGVVKVWSRCEGPLSCWA